MREINTYLRYLIIIFFLLFITYLSVFYSFLKFKLDIDNMQIVTFSNKYLWILLLTTLVFIYATYMFFLKKALNPIKEISKTTQRIVERRFPSNMFYLDKNINELQLVGAINQIAEQIESQLYHLEEFDIRLQGIVENMSNGIILVNKDRRISLINKATEDLFGYNKNEFIGKRHIEAIKHDEINKNIEKCFLTREKINDEINIYYPNERIVQVNFAPMKNENNELLGIVVILNDITDIRKFEKMRTDFVANVSHELKTPITSIKGFTETLLEGAYKDNETALSFLNIMSLEGDRLLNIVNDLLDLSKIESNKMILEIEKINLRELIELSLKTLEIKINEREISIIVDIESNMEVSADKSKLSQIILNLLENAIMYTPMDGSITIGAIREYNYYKIYIKDTGVGIPDKDKERIFERFYRIDKSRVRANGGTGLGLSIVKHLIEIHKGK